MEHESILLTRRNVALLADAAKSQIADFKPSWAFVYRQPGKPPDRTVAILAFVLLVQRKWFNITLRLSVFVFTELTSMGICKDPTLTYLNKFGYNVVRLPRTGIEPMCVLGQEHSLEMLGPLSTVWKTSAPEPAAGPPQPVADLNGKQSDKLELSIGLKILANALAGFGASVPSLAFAFTRARKVQFTYSGVTSSAVAPFEAGKYLASGDLDEANPVVRSYFLDDDAQAYLIVDVLKSRSLSVEALAADGSGVDLDVPAIQGAVGASIGVQSKNSSSSMIEFEGKTPVTFGFKAFAISFEDGCWSLRGAKPGQNLAFAFDPGGETEDEPGGVLFTTSGMVSLQSSVVA